MRYALASAAILSAVTIGEVMAGPTHHIHRHLHEKKDVIDVKKKRGDTVTATIDGVVVSWVNNYFGPSTASETPAVATHAAEYAAAAAVTPTSSAKAATVAATSTSSSAQATSTSSDLVSSLESDIETIWNKVVGYSNGRTTFGESSITSGSAGDNYYGNCGVPYGSNIIVVPSREGYDFTNEFINTSGETISVFIWNKIGSDGQVLSGSALAPTETALTFSLAAGASKIVAFGEDSQVGWAQACNKKAASGAFATTWGEANFVSTGSGYDMSAIMNPAGNTYNMSISSTEAPACTSNMQDNYWLTATEPIGNSDGSCYISQSTATLTTYMGGYVS